MYARPADTGTLHEVAPFPAELGAEVLAAGPEEVRLLLGWTPERTTAGGAMHGGALMALADTAGALCAFLHLPDGGRHDHDRVEDELPARRARATSRQIA